MNHSITRPVGLTWLVFAATSLFCLLVFVPVLTAQQNSQSNTVEGTVLETMNAAGYTYVNVSTPDGTRWVAIPESKIETGASLAFSPGMEMKDFHSKSLGKTFPSIIFSPGLAGQKPASPHGSLASSKPKATDSFEAAVQAERQAASSPSSQIQPAQGSGGSQGAIAPYSEISVEKAAGENSFTVGELFEKKKELDGKQVRIRGQVVKYNPNIMGRNWLHLQDGTGDPMHNTHDLVVTTTAEIGSPEIITIEGTLAADKDFGAGYSYAVIIENAAIIK